MIFFYRLCWAVLRVFLPLYLSLRCYRGKEDKSRLGERYGLSTIPRPTGDIYWLHCASVGEAVSALALAEAMHKINHSAYIILTSGTVTSAEMIARHIDSNDLSDFIIHQYHPHDHPLWIDRFLDHWRPSLAVMMESEIWPNMIIRSAARGIPTALASARLSLKSLKRWQLFGGSLRGAIFNSLSLVLASDGASAAYFQYLGIRADRLAVCGNLKSAAKPLGFDMDYHHALSQATAGRIVILLASSHGGEEQIFIDALTDLGLEGDGHLAIIAPRHIGRAPAIKSLIAEQFERPERAGQINSRSESRLPNDGLYWLADKMGEMGTLIRLADIVVLGGGFADLGGHNPMEVAALGKGVISGRHTFKNQAAFDALDKTGGLIYTDTAGELADAIAELLASNLRRERHNSGAHLAYRGLDDGAALAAEKLIALTQNQHQHQYQHQGGGGGS